MKNLETVSDFIIKSLYNIKFTSTTFFTYNICKVAHISRLHVDLVALIFDLNLELSPDLVNHDGPCHSPIYPIPIQHLHHLLLILGPADHDLLIIHHHLLHQLQHLQVILQRVWPTNYADGQAIQDSSNFAILNHVQIAAIFAHVRHLSKSLDQQLQWLKQVLIEPADFLWLVLNSSDEMVAELAPAIDQDIYVRQKLSLLFSVWLYFMEMVPQA